MDKHLIVFPVPPPYGHRLKHLMDEVAKVTGIYPPHWRLPPHITICKPQSGLDERALKSILYNETRLATQAQVTITGLFPFKKHYVVCNVHTTQTIAQLWAGITSRVSLLSGYKRDEHEGKNTLHITIAERTSRVFDRAWPTLCKMHVKPMTVPLEQVILYKQRESRWEIQEIFNLPA